MTDRRAAASWTDAALAAAIGFVAAATRWAQRGHALFSFDSGLLAAGIREFDFASGWPHPPYYPLAVAMGKVLAPWTGEVGALVLLAVAATGVMAAFTFLTARAFTGRAAAALAAAIVVLSPTAFSNGISPLSYALEGAASAVVAWAAWRCRAEPTARSAVALAVATSAALGIRLSSLFLVAPLAFWAVWRRPRAMAWGLGSGAVATAAWAVPALVAGGGWEWFLKGTSYQSHHVVFAVSAFEWGWPMARLNLAILLSYLPDEAPFLGVVALLAAVSAFAWWPHRAKGPVRSFLATWMLPSLLFFTLVYSGWPVFPSGYVMPLLPAFGVAVAAFAQAFARGVRSSGAPPFARGLAYVALAAVVATPATWAAGWTDAAQGQREADGFSQQLDGLRDVASPDDTAIVTLYGWYWVRFQLGDYLAWGVQPYWNETGASWVQVIEGQDGRAMPDGPPTYANAMDGTENPQHPVPPHVKRIVQVYGPPRRGEADVLKPDLPVQRRTLENGLRYDVLELEGLGFTTIEQALRWHDAQGRGMPA